MANSGNDNVSNNAFEPDEHLLVYDFYSALDRLNIGCTEYATKIKTDKGPLTSSWN